MASGRCWPATVRKNGKLVRAAIAGLFAVAWSHRKCCTGCKECLGIAVELCRVMVVDGLQLGGRPAMG